MAWELTEDVDAFAAVAGEFLRSRPVEHTVLLTLVDTLRRRGPHAYGPADPVFGLWRAPGGAVDGVLLQTPPFPMMFSRLPAEAVPAAVDAVAGRTLPGVNLLAADADVFVTGWRRRTGVAATVHMRTRLYRLGTLTPPAVPPPGKPRIARPDDRDLLLRWIPAFHDDIGERQVDFAPAVDDRIGYGGVTLWEVDGVAVAMAITSRPEAGTVRIQMVYTAPEHRGRGYGGAVTTAATRTALDTGAASVVLVTDLANPTSNALYQRLGYRPIEDRTVVDFA
jgi:ribosomal protein S18 acetylase RimI-like enzyme